MEPSCDVAGCHHVGRPLDEAPCVAHHTVIEMHSRPLEPLDRRRDSQPEHHEVRGHQAAVVEANAFDVAVADQTARADAGAQSHSVVDVELAHDVSHATPERALERRTQGVDERDFEPAPAAGRRHLGSDEARTDHADGGVRVQRDPQRQGVVDGAERVHTHHPAAVRPTGQRPRLAAGRDDQAIESDPLVPIRAADGDLARLKIELLRHRTEADIGVEVANAKVDLGSVPIAGQELLRKRRTLIRPVDLVADDGQPPVEALAPQRLSGARAGQRRSDHRHVIQPGQGVSPPPG